VEQGVSSLQYSQGLLKDVWSGCISQAEYNYNGQWGKVIRDAERLLHVSKWAIHLPIISQ